MNQTQWLVAVAALAVIIVGIVAAVVAARRTKERSAMLKERFGPEYERTVQQLGARRGERVLAKRVRHVERVHVRDLREAERTRFTSAWSVIQSQFVDDPPAAVQRANDLIKEVMRARGYSANEGFEQRAADLSVDHPDVVQHYRAAHALARAGTEHGVNTEDLRQSVVHYRAIFADLLEPARVEPRMHEHSFSHA